MANFQYSLLFQQLTENRNIKKFIHDNFFDDINNLILKYKEYQGVDIEYIVRQIEGKRKARKKFPFLYHNEAIVYPYKQNIEQASSEEAAKFKASFYSGTCLVDLTGGMGIDSYFFSLQFEKVIYVEQDPELFAIAAWNFDKLSANNIEMYNDTAENILHTLKDEVDIIYIDPSRRVGDKRMFLPEDCKPDVSTLLKPIFQKTSNVLIKLSPLLNISSIYNTLNNLFSIKIIAIKNECKEILAHLKKEINNSESIQIEAFNKEEKRLQQYTTTYNEYAFENCETYFPEKYLYEPNAAILKSGRIKKLCLDFGLKKLHDNTHLFTSDEKKNFFPGRRFLIKDVLDLKDKNKIYQYCVNGKINIIRRNFPLSVEALKKRLKLKEGGDYFIIACKIKNHQNKLLVASKI